MSQHNRGEPTRQERRQQRVREEAQRRSQAQLRKRLVIVGSIIVVLVLVVAAGYVLVRLGGSGVPTGTDVFSEPDKAHTTGPVQYDRLPPAGGAHNAVWLNCGVYDQPVPNENAVHSLEHGAVWVTYQPSLPSSAVTTLRQIVTSHYIGSQRYLIMSPYSGLPAPIVASAWGAQLPLQNASDPRLVSFIQHFASGSQGGEPGASCTGGTGTPIG